MVDRAAPALEAVGLVKRYRDLAAVDGVDLTVRRGDVYGFLGPNGAGKSTTIRMLLGLIRPTEGTVRLLGRDRADHGVRALDGVAGFVDQPAFYPYLSARENLRLLAALDRRRDPPLDAVLETVDLERRGGDRVGTFSTGMRQRLAIAAALLPRPELIILDEPTNGLDPMGIRDMRTLVQSLARDDGITVLLSSHLLAEVEQVCNRAAIIVRARRRWEGEVAALLAGRRRVRLRARPIETARRVAGELGAETHEVEPGLLHVLEGTGAITPAALVARLAAAGVEVDEIAAEAPTLEEVFVSLVREVAA